MNRQPRMSTLYVGLLLVLPMQCGRRTDCPPLRYVTNGSPPPTTSCSQNPAPPGTQCSFSCPQEKTLIGFQVVTCFQDGTWSSATPRCDGPSCPSLSHPSGGSTSGSCFRAKSQDVCRFSCGAGQLVGSPTLVCGPDLNWNSAPPTCSSSSGAAGSCPSLNAPVNGFAIGSCRGASSNQRCNFSCNSGYTLSGSPGLQCMQDGTWSAAIPVCIRTN